MESADAGKFHAQRQDKERGRSEREKTPDPSMMTWKMLWIWDAWIGVCGVYGVLDGMHGKISVLYRGHTSCRLCHVCMAVRQVYVYNKIPSAQPRRLLKLAA